MRSFELWIAGVPAPGGSKTAYPIYSKGKLVLKNGRPIIRMVDDAGKRNKLWRQIVSAEALAQFRQPAWTCPISVEFHFVMPRPKYHYGTGRNSAVLRPDSPTLHCVKPDLTKLIRSTEDALTGRLWVDDAQIWQQAASKLYGDRPGCRVVILATSPPATLDFLALATAPASSEG